MSRFCNPLAAVEVRVVPQGAALLAAAPRKKILEDIALVGREHSDATVLFHSTIASLLEIHPTDYKVLGMLERLGPMTAGQIAQHSGSPRPR
jgi:hypothetical protein